VEIPTHYSGALEFADGTVGNISMSFDVWTHSLPAIEIYGTEGTLKVPDPNFFCGPVYLRRAGDEAWTEMPLLYPYAENSRGLGLYDMADAICRGEKHRASGELGAHVLDAMLGFSDSAESGKQYRMKGTCTRPEPFQMLSKQS
jgi:predicted dehydrogenase